MRLAVVAAVGVLVAVSCVVVAVLLVWHVVLAVVVVVRLRCRGLSRGHSGMFPCFLGGRLARLVRRARSARTTCTRVSDGRMTAST